MPFPPPWYHGSARRLQARSTTSSLSPQVEHASLKRTVSEPSTPREQLMPVLSLQACTSQGCASGWPCSVDSQTQTVLLA